MTDDETSEDHINELCLYIGRVVIACTKLENDTTLALATILGLNEVQERCLVRPMGTQVKVNTIKTLAKKHLNGQKRKLAIDAAEAVSNIAERRNDLVHGQYVHIKKKVAVISFSGASRLDGNPTRWTPKELAFFLVTIRSARADIQNLRTLFPSPLTSPKT